MALKPPGLSGCPVTVAVAFRQPKMWVDGNLFEKGLPHWHCPSLSQANPAPVVPPVFPIPMIDRARLSTPPPPSFGQAPLQPSTESATSSSDNVSFDDDRDQNNWEDWD
jgi:hypothetical protein